MYHAAAVLLRPLVLALLAVAVALAVLWRRKESRRRLAALTAAFVVLTLLCLPVTAYLALGTLEWAYPPLSDRPSDVPVVVVLSGSLRSGGPRIELGTDTLYRCIRAAELYRTAPGPVLVTGGKVHPNDPGPPLAVAMRDFLATLGVRPEDVIVEPESRTTYENAVESARLLKERGIGRVVLVTDASHLRRAAACFRKQGVDVVPCGCRYRALALHGGAADFVPDPGAAAGFEAAAHEWVGIAWYWVTGKI